jgi:hypothetical protein
MDMLAFLTNRFSYYSYFIQNSPLSISSTVFIGTVYALLTLNYVVVPLLSLGSKFRRLYSIWI